MKKRSVPQIELMTIILVLLSLSQLFIAALTAGSFQRLYTEFIASRYSVIGTELKRSIELGLKFGKPIDRLFGIEGMLQECKRKNHELEDIVVYRPEGEILYSLKEGDLHKTVPAPLITSFSKDAQGAKKKVPYTLYKSQYHVQLPLMAQDDKWVGTLGLAFDEAIINQKIRQIILWNVEISGIIVLCSALILAVMLRFFIRFDDDATKVRNRLILIVGLISVAAQLCYSFLNLDQFEKDYVSITRSKVETIGGQLKDDIEKLLGKGVQINRLVKLDVLFGEVIQSNPEVAAIVLTDAEHSRLYVSHAEGSSKEKAEEASEVRPGAAPPENKADGDPYELVLPLKGLQAKSATQTAQGGSGSSQVQGYLRIAISRDHLKTTVRGVWFDALTVVLTAFLFSFELMIFLAIYIRSHRTEATAKEAMAFSYVLARPVGFMYLFAAAISVSFMPLYMKQLYQPIAGLSRDLVLALPISAEMLCSTITAILAGIMVDKKGWAFPFFLGAIVTALGNLLSASAATGLQLILYRGIAGLGYGLAWMSIQGFVFVHTHPDLRARGISNLVAGIISGHICGTAVGALLAERIGFEKVLAAGGVLTFLPFLFILIYMRPYLAKMVSQDSLPRPRLSDFINYLTDRNIISLLLLSMVPYSVCLIGFMNYATPIYLSSIGIPQSSIGRVLMIYGLCVIYLAPLISGFIDQTQSKKIFIAAGGFVGGIGLSVVYFFQGIGVIVLAIFLLGLAGSLIGPAQSAFLLRLKITQNIGLGKAMSVQRAADKLGQMLGPLCLGVMVSFMGLEKGIALSGIVFIMGALLLLILVREPKASDR